MARTLANWTKMDWGLASLDAYRLLRSLIGKTIKTLSREKPNAILRVEGSQVYVGTQKAPAGEPVPVSELQAALDRMAAGEEVEVSVDSLGHRSSFIGAVLAQVPGAVVLPTRPRRVRLR
jgi:hypothetical protein